MKKTLAMFIVVAGFIWAGFAADAGQAPKKASTVTTQAPKQTPTVTTQTTQAPKQTPTVTNSITSGMSVGPVGVTRSCPTSGQGACSTSVSAGKFGATVSVSTSGDVCAGGSAKGGVGVVGSVSAVGCVNVRDGSRAVKGCVATGLGAGVDDVSVTVTGGTCTTIRTPAPPASGNSAGNTSPSRPGRPIPLP